MSGDYVSKEALLSVARVLDVRSVSDALDRLGMEGAVVGLRPLSVPDRVAGIAVTVKLAPFRPDQPGPGRHLGTAAVEACGPGDLVLADRSGVIFAPAGVAARVLDVATSIKGREDGMAAEIRAGRPVSEVMNARYEDMLRGEDEP